MKRTIAMCLSCAMLAGMLPAASAASPMGGAGTAYALGGSVRATVYNVSTQAEFEAALANAENGATIQLTGDVATRTITDAPLVIGKSVTIEGGGNSLLLGSGGIVLEADVTMRNLKLGQGNMVRNAIMANGHTLELDNVQQVTNSGRGEFHLFCGSLTGAEDNGYTNKNTGTHGRIILRGNSRFAAVYAGNYYDNLNGGGFYGGTAEQGTWAGSSSVEIDRSMTGKVPEIYAYGAWMYRSTGAVSKPVTPDPLKCPIKKDFSVSIYGSAVERVHGSTEADAAPTLVTYNGTGDLNDTLVLNSISGLTVQSGYLKPSASFREADAPVSVASGAVLGFNNFTENSNNTGNITIGDFTGGGSITIADGQQLQISGEVSGTTAVALGDYFNDASTVPIAENTSKTLITAPTSTSDRAFTFKPYGRQNVLFSPDGSGAWIAESRKEVTPIQGVSLEALTEIQLPVVSDPDPDTDQEPDPAPVPDFEAKINIQTTWGDNTSGSLELIPDLSISVNGKPAKEGEDPYPGNFEGAGSGYTYYVEIENGEWLGISIVEADEKEEPGISEVLTITRLVDGDFSKFPPEGLYFIQMKVPARYTVGQQELTAEGTLRIYDGASTDQPEKVTPPTSVSALTYNGQEQTAYSDSNGYTVTGATGTNAGEYTATFILNNGYVWADGKYTPKNITWKIAPAEKPGIDSDQVQAIAPRERADGTITPGGLSGTTNEMEYRPASGGDWTRCDNGVTAIQNAGSYKIRYLAPDGNWIAGNALGLTVPEAVKINSISIAQMPTKTTYTVGDPASALDLSGLVLSLHWADDKTDTLTVTDAAAQGITVSGADFGTAAENLPITVTFRNMSATFSVAVTATGEPEITGIAVNSTAHKTVYTVGGAIDLDGLTILVTRESGSETIPVTAEMISGFDTSSAGTRTVTITYGGQSTQFDIIVQEKSTPDPDPDPEPTPEPEPIPDDEPEDASFDRKPNSGGSSPSAGKPSEPSAPVQPETPVAPETPTEWQNPYTADVSPREWYYEAVQYVSESGLMSGTGNGTFSPEVKLSRGMLAQILYNQEGRPAAGGNSFTDVPGGEWFTDAVSWAAASSIVSGYSNGAFGPSDDITREQFILILYRYAKMKGCDVSVSGTANLLGYADASQISDYAREAMAWACEKGLISGTNRGTLSPTGGATRAEAAAILMRFLENVGGK